MSKKDKKSPLSQKLGLFLAPVAFLIVLALPPVQPLTYAGQVVLAIATWMIIWWVTEAVDLAVTALLPIILFPLMGVLSVKEATAPYGNPIIFLFMGGFMIAIAMEKWKLHLRIALTIVKLTGTKANGIIFGFMLATAVLSMWISNTATTVMMLPIATSIIRLLIHDEAEGDRRLHNFSLSMLLGIAYGANIGGVATIIGTPPNSLLASIFLDKYGYELSFANWFMLGLPFATVFLVIGYWLLVKVIYPNNLGHFEGSAEIVDNELKKLGKMSKAERYTLIIFLATAFLWISRGTLNSLIPGLALNDTLIAVIGAVALFLTPLNFQKGEFILKWEDTKNLPWGILILFGGGLSLAGALDKAGIVNLIGDGIANNMHMTIFLVTLLLITLVVFVTSVMSNVALVTVVIPLVAGLSVSLHQNPLLITIPITIAASCAFMLPMGTPPNAIVFASGRVHVSDMVKAGFIFNLVAIVLLIILSQTLVPYIFGIQADVVPLWAK